MASSSPSPPTIALSKSSLRKHLSTIDSNSLPHLQLLFASLVAATAEPTRHAAVKSIPAGSLSESEAFTYFSFSNPMQECFGYVHYKVPELTLRDASARNMVPTPWLNAALSKCGRVWSNRNEAGRRLMLDLLVMECLDKLKETEVDEVQSDSDDHSDHSDHSTPSRPLLAFPELTMSRLCTTLEGIPLLVTGRCDVGIGYLQPGTTKPENAALLSIIEAKGSDTFEAAWPQLLTYLGIAHHARKHADKHNCTVYGIYSNGQKYCFVSVDNESLVHRSRVYNLVTELNEIYAFTCSILRSVRRSSPTTSPVKPRAKRMADILGFAQTVQGEYFDFETVLVSKEEVMDFQMGVGAGAGTGA